MSDIYHYREITSSKTVVVKLGTRLLTHENGKLNLEYMQEIIKKLAGIKDRGRQVILVSSGAVGAGIGKMEMKHKPSSTPEKQASAAVGQGLLVQYYENFFAQYHHIVAQILLTRADLMDRQRYINASNTIFTLLKWGVIPVINENDTVSVEEIEFGDNDLLAALVSGLIDAELLINLTDIEGLYNDNPQYNKNAELIPVVEKITPEIKKWAGSSSSNFSTGGMQAKIRAAEIAVNSGVNMIVASGHDVENISRILNGEPVGTLFLAQENYLCRRKRWIAYGRVPQGALVVDEGARNALVSGNKSLLPVGVVEVKGNFEQGDLVYINDQEGREIGRGLVNFNSNEISQILNLSSREIYDILDRHAEEEVVHRDNMVIN